MKVLFLYTNMKQYYYTYKITLLKGSLKSCYYLGLHITDDLNDGYCGSGRIIRDYYKKYGAIEGVTYTKEILGFYNNQEELNQAEYELIGDLYKTDTKCLNLRAGGMQAGISNKTKDKISESTKKAMQRSEVKEKIKERPILSGEDHGMYGKHHTKEAKEKIRLSNLGRKVWNKGKQSSEETKQKISENRKGKTAGENHPLFGKHHTDESKEKNRISHLGKPVWNSGKANCYSDETRKRMSLAHSGKESPIKGKHCRINPETNKREYYE